ncbi:ribbon-helix-helix CopG family protein [Knoellia remsis]|uniref:Ribbon-helix-helix CopG family protein n=1 Tax=Knoellia remsis TaxID=407159 RepID=A0A2T0UN59_9MICO|nr:ribbon-helix-helix protein, CopG family [Knoellia remsis]PRY59350.1 ribbon-helix-helix CopG family protein [Knoellia remsis]
MATLQVKNVPDELYAAVKERAAKEHMTVSDLVLRNLRREVERMSVDEWLERVTSRRAGEPPRDIDVQAVMDEVRAELG